MPAEEPRSFAPSFPIVWRDVAFDAASLALTIIIVAALCYTCFRRASSRGKTSALLSQRVTIFASLCLILLVTIVAGIHIRDICTIVIESGGTPDPAPVYDAVRSLGTYLLWLAVAFAALLISLLLHWTTPRSEAPPEAV